MVDRLFADSYLAGIYDEWHPRHVRHDYDFYLPLILAADAVLDVGCGTGTLLREARQVGHAGLLCGLDPAPAMLDRARVSADIEWWLGDLQSTGWTERFDLVVMTGHAFQTIIDDAELREFLASVRRALVPNGCFAFETRNPTARAWERWTPAYAVNVEGPDGQDVGITTEIVGPVDGGTITFTHTFSGEHASLPMVSQSTLRFLDTGALRDLLGEAGLRIKHQFGDFDRRPLDPEGPEIITLAVRA